jgi:cell division septal protein FtsQ
MEYFLKEPAKLLKVMEKHVNTKKIRKSEHLRKKQQRNILISLFAGGLLLVVAGIAIAQNARDNKTDPSLIELVGKPSLKVDQELIDFGDIKLNTNLTFTLDLTNIGDQPLMISQAPYIEVKEGC